MKRALLVLAFVLFALAVPTSADWVAWRGPKGTGIASDQSAPLTWSSTENIKWKVKLPGPGNSTPIVWQDRVFLTQATENGTVYAPEEIAALATSAQLLGAGERVLANTVAYAKQRKQFGREIGSYQAIKHQLADVRIALDFARPLVYGAAVDLSPRSVSAAEVQCADGGNLVARVGVQVHGAIGYTQEHDLSLWLLRIRALRSAWGTPAFHRERLLADLLASR